MAKVSLEQIEATLLERKIDQPTVSAIIKDLAQAIEEDKEDKANENGPKAKWEHLIVLNDPDGLIKTDMTGWVIVQQDGQDAGLALGKLTDAAKSQNEGAKRKKTLITSFGELFQALKPKNLKEKQLKIKTKEAVRVLIVNGKTL
jgi:hypothetical protein